MFATNNRPTKEEWQKTMEEIVGNGNMDVRGAGSCKSLVECQGETCEILGITMQEAIKYGFIKNPKPEHNFFHFILNYILNFIYFFRNWSSSMRQNKQLREEKARLISLTERLKEENESLSRQINEVKHEISVISRQDARPAKHVGNLSNIIRGLREKNARLQEIIKRLSRQLAEQEYELSVVRREDLRPGRLVNIQSGVITDLRDKIAQLTKENHQLKGENPPSNFFLPQTRTKDSSSSGNAQVLTLTPQNNEGDGDTEMPKNISQEVLCSEMVNDTPGNDTSQDVDTFENPSFMGDEMGASSAELAEKRFLESLKNNGGNYKKNIKIYII